jgi:hypothetical protein
MPMKMEAITLKDKIKSIERVLKERRNTFNNTIEK